ncbi:cytochrome c oxidase subunit 2 [Kineococcus xinjiangensis]|uniref:cytochrome-c oxidase n=1 Tax=Kineococcus xinjiangensis TaxID=512762 RepID=A0A2S6IMC0_9ACTN|nr:cytochrome c oxidase subunit II [Kineococcus xinjiangensis]PPK95305.1 cytochrome c oxidase subunit 2 [Kineococcus xinjiangensis]
MGATLFLAACGERQAESDFAHGYLPIVSDGATNMTPRIQTLWNGSWIAALLVGLVVWGLTLWCVVAYRRRKGDPQLPPQVRYNMPIEILYTVLPVMMVGVLFFYTARDEAAILENDGPVDVKIDVIGKKWGWDFNYNDEDVYVAGRQAVLTGVEGVEETLPTLVLPVDQTVEVEVYGIDVNHSFWVPAWLFKMDAIAGAPNEFHVTPTKIGMFQGKCAELCGEYHSEMLFNVQVVEQDEYEAFIESLRDQGNTGQLITELAGALEREAATPQPEGESEAAEELTPDGH